MLLLQIRNVILIGPAKPPSVICGTNCLPRPSLLPTPPNWPHSTLLSPSLLSSTSSFFPPLLGFVFLFLPMISARLRSLLAPFFLEPEQELFLASLSTVGAPLSCFIVDRNKLSFFFYTYESSLTISISTRSPPTSKPYALLTITTPPEIRSD